MPPKQGGQAKPAGAGMFLNLERVPPLAPKFTNQIGKTCAGFRLAYMATGVAITVGTTVLNDGSDIPVGSEPEWISIPEWERRRALRNAPSEEERLSGMRRKYELRLNRAFPAQGPQTGSEEHMQAWLATLPWNHRRALLMSQKDFAKSYPEGFRDPQ
jgi:hypothetical protein